MTGILFPPHFNDPLHNEPRTAEIPVFVFPDADDLWCQTAFGELLMQFYFIKMLVESDGNNGRLDLPDRAEHVSLIPKNCMGDRFKSGNHLEAVLFRE